MFFRNKQTNKQKKLLNHEKENCLNLSPENGYIQLIKSKKKLIEKTTIHIMSFKLFKEPN